MKTLEECWQEMRGRLEDVADPAELDNFREAFYAGAQCVFNIAILAGPKDSLAAAKGIWRELREHMDRIESEMN